MRSRQIVTREEVTARDGAVAATRYHEAQAGVDCLRDGGTAVDAAVAAAFVACVIEPFNTSIGGCGFMLVHDPVSGRPWSIEFPTRAPAAARPDMFRVLGAAPGSSLGTWSVEHDANSSGCLATGVPGTVAGLVEAHRRFGRLPLHRVVEPAVDLARRGFRSDVVYDAIAAAYRPLLRRSELAASRLLVNGEAPLSLLGQRLPQPELADAIEQVGRDGGESFHRGDIARAIVDDVSRGGGVLSIDDLANYRPIVGEPTWAAYRGRRVATTSSPSGGWTVLQALRILDRFDLTALGRDDPERWHLVIAALRHAFADRYAYLGDPDSGPVPLAGMLSDGYVDELAALVRAGALDELYPDPQPWTAFAAEPLHDPWPHDPDAGLSGPGSPTDGGRHGTVHVTAADRDGMLVSCTHTIGDVFGAKVMAGPGVLLNSGMQWFSPVPGGPNSIEAGKRPLANMAPVLVYDGDRPVLGAGALGGRRIISAVTQVVVDVVDHGWSPQQACESSRIDASERVTYVGEGVGDQVIAALGVRGHRTDVVREDHDHLGIAFANATAIGLDPDGLIRCGVDARRTCEAMSAE
jgi:gamma-glutamyltranspeptidase/glutathione hydrolase